MELSAQSDLTPTSAVTSGTRSRALGSHRERSRPETARALGSHRERSRPETARAETARAETARVREGPVDSLCGL